MFFKNLCLFRLVQPFELSVEDFELQLSDNVFIPCANYEKSRIGWVPPLGDAAPDLDVESAEESEESGSNPGPMLTHVIGDYIMICAQQQDRLLPASVVREATQEKVAEIEQRQARKVYRKERREIQDTVYGTLLPRAFTRSSLTYAYISRGENLLVVDAASPTKAEDLVNLLRDTLGSFQVSLPDSKSAPSAVMTRWLKEGRATDHFDIHDDCELVNQKDGSNVVRCKGQDLMSDEIQAHINAGKVARQLGVNWHDHLNCILTEDLSIKRLRFNDMREESDSFDEETPAQKFDQEFALMTLELSGFFKSLFNAFGGLNDANEKVLPDNRDKGD